MLKLIVLTAAVAYCTATYLGCFLDDRSRDLRYGPYLGTTNSPENCINKCTSLAYEYAGVQNGDQCFCDDRYGTKGKKPENDCSKDCPTGNGQKCGNSWRNSVYRTNYRGCHLDTSSRDLNGLNLAHGHRMPDDLATRDTCIYYCKAKGFAYAGLQVGVQCFCGNAYSSHGEKPKSDCGTACRAESGAKCGGTWRNSVYSTGLDCKYQV